MTDLLRLLTTPGLLSSGGLNIQTLTLQTDAGITDDTFIHGGAATLNYGAFATIVVGGDASANKLRGLLAFNNLSPIQTGATILSATLTLYCSAENDTTDRTVTVHRSLVQWWEGSKNGSVPSAGENASTWNLRNFNGSLTWVGGAGGAAGGDWVASPTASASITGAGATFSFDVTADVAAWIAGSANNYGWWILNASEATADSAKQFASSAAATATQRPKLEVVYVNP